MVPSRRPWKADVAGPVRRITHDTSVRVAPLQPDTLRLWDHARAVLGLTGAAGHPQR
jgi:hypothetical protein